MLELCIISAEFLIKFYLLSYLIMHPIHLKRGTGNRIYIYVYIYMYLQKGTKGLLALFSIYNIFSITIQYYLLLYHLFSHK